MNKLIQSKSKQKQTEQNIYFYFALNFSWFKNHFDLGCQEAILSQLCFDHEEKVTLVDGKCTWTSLDMDTHPHDAFDEWHI